MVKAPSPILVTVFGIVIEVKLLQPEKAKSRIIVTELGFVIDCKPLQLRKA